MLFNGDHLGMQLGDLGADVIKVECPGRGDYLRDMLGQIVPHHSPAHLQVNKNKRSVTLDLRTEAGREVFWNLVATADVFVDGNAADALDRLGIGYDAQVAVKPDIVYCHYTGFGATGPYAPIPTHGQMMNALAGGMPVLMGEDGLVHPAPGRPYMGGTVSGGEATAAGGVYAAFHVAAALVRRDRTGRGCRLDVSGAEAVLSAAWIGATYNLNYERIQEFVGLSPQSRAPASSPRRGTSSTRPPTAATSCSAASSPSSGTRSAASSTGTTSPADHGDAPVDFGHGDEELRRELQAIFHSRTQAEWIELAAQHDLCLGPAHRLEDLRHDPQLQAREALLEGEHPVAGPFTYVAQPTIADGERVTQVRRPAPRLGEHTDEVLAELGYDDDARQGLRAAGAV